jgi:hypothetical protein
MLCEAPTHSCKQPSSAFPLALAPLQVLSWVFAPILAALASALLYGTIRTFILRSKNAYRRTLVLLPLLVFVTFFVITWFTIVK